MKRQTRALNEAREQRHPSHASTPTMFPTAERIRWSNPPGARRRW